MHDPRVLLDPATDAVRRLARRGYQLDLDKLGSLLSGRNAAIGEVESARAESRRTAQEVQATAKRREDTGELVERGRALKAQIAAGERRQQQLDDELRALLLGIPNLPEDRCPDGDSEDFAVEIRRWGDLPVFGFEPADHAAIGERLGIFDFARAAKLSGPRFAVL
jgi:seryl-tRNA synthetase